MISNNSTQQSFSSAIYSYQNVQNKTSASSEKNFAQIFNQTDMDGDNEKMEEVRRGSYNDTMQPISSSAIASMSTTQLINALQQSNNNDKNYQKSILDNNLLNTMLSSTTATSPSSTTRA